MQAVALNGQTWCICGGRDFKNRDMFDACMGQLINAKGCPSKIIHGNARGADTMAAEWGKQMALDVVPFKADWAAQGVFAGPQRNQQMLDEGKPSLVVAFPGGNGTADMIRRAKKAAVEVAECRL